MSYPFDYEPERPERHCEYCNKYMSPSEVNDYGSLCETCYMREYYGK